MKMIIVWNKATKKTEMAKEYSEENLNLLCALFIKHAKSGLTKEFNSVIASYSYQSFLELQDILDVYSHLFEILYSDDFEKHLNDVNQYSQQLNLNLVASIIKTEF